jgi:hypothetical protein
MKPEPFDDRYPRSGASALDAIENPDLPDVRILLQPVIAKLSADRGSCHAGLLLGLLHPPSTDLNGHAGLHREARTRGVQIELA